MSLPTPSPNSRAGIALGIYNHLDEVITRHFAGLTKDKYPPCTSGCSHCCNHNFLWNSLELALALQAHSFLHPNNLHRLAYRAEKSIRYATKEYPFFLGQFVEWSRRGEEPPGREEMAEYIGKLNGVHDLPCLFLAEDRCLIYPWRPLICRAYGWAEIFVSDLSSFITPNCQPLTAAPERNRYLTLIPEFSGLYDRINRLSSATVNTNLPLLAWFHFHADVRNGEWLEKTYLLTFIEDYTANAPASPLPRKR